MLVPKVMLSPAVPAAGQVVHQAALYRSDRYEYWVSVNGTPGRLRNHRKVLSSCLTSDESPVRSRFRRA